MTYYALKDYQEKAGDALSVLRIEGELILMVDEKPVAVLMRLDDSDDIEAMLQAIRQAKAMISFNRQRAKDIQPGTP
jgi:hypothetical protein